MTVPENWIDIEDLTVDEAEGYSNLARGHSPTPPEPNFDPFHTLNLDVNCTQIGDIEDARTKAARYRTQ